MTPTDGLEVIGSRRTVSLRAIVDTGFDGFLCLPIPLAVSLGLELVDTVNIELADGTKKSELVFAGSVRFLSKVREIGILVTESEDALIGTNLLDDCQMTIDFATGKIRLSRKPPGRKHLE